MKKVGVVFFLLVFNFCIVYAKIKDNHLNHVDIKLTGDELGIVTIKLDNSTSLLLKYQDKYLLYLIDYIDSKNIKTSEAVFTDYIDYVYMNNNYNYNEDNAKIVDKQVIEELVLSRNVIDYKDYRLCINQSTNCDFVFITHNDVMINENVKAIFYSTDLDEQYIDYLEKIWTDSYRISKDSYTIMTLGDDYEVNNLVK